MPPEYITDRELNLALDPLKADIWEMKADVKTLVLAAAQQKGAADQQKKQDAKTRFLSDRRLAYAAIIGSLIAPVAWLHF